MILGPGDGRFLTNLVERSMLQPLQPELSENVIPSTGIVPNQIGSMEVAFFRRIGNQ